MMEDSFIKDFPRGDSKEIRSLENLLPICTDHLNQLNTSMYFVERLKQIASGANSNLVAAITDVEKQGKFNAFLNVCFLDYIVVYKNALSAIHFWEETYSLRQGYLLIYEALVTYKTHSKHLKELADKAAGAAPASFDAVSAEIKQFKKDYEYETTIKAIRVDTIGHIQKEPAHFFDRISKLDQNKAFAALKAFVSILVDLLKLSDQIFIDYTKKITVDASFKLAAMNQYSDEIDKLLNSLNSLNMGTI